MQALITLMKKRMPLRNCMPLMAPRIKKPGPTRTWFNICRLAEAYPVTEWSRLPEEEAVVAGAADAEDVEARVPEV